jgi:Holliday junction resolvase RusA-like endonuclease
MGFKQKHSFFEMNSQEAVWSTHRRDTDGIQKNVKGLQEQG